MGNRTVIHRRAAADLLAIDSTAGFHRYAIEHAIERYRTWCAERGLSLGSVLAIGANRREAQAFVEHPFAAIRLTGLLESDEVTRVIIDGLGESAYKRVQHWSVAELREWILDDRTTLLYNVSRPYQPGNEHGFRFDDPAIGVEWPREIISVSEKDKAWPALA